VVIPADHYLRQFVRSGAFDEIDDGDLHYVASESGVMHQPSRELLESLPNFHGYVTDPRKRAKRPYGRLRDVLLAALAGRSFTMRHKLSLLASDHRRRLQLLALPGIRQVYVRRALAAAGQHEPLVELMRRLRPDVVLTPTGGYDTLVWDALRAAQATGTPTVALIHNWDNLSSKGAFAVRPDHLAVWGEQSAVHAQRIHGFAAGEVTAVGSPALDAYFHHEPGNTTSPFPFRYALFAGCYAPFDEAAALEHLDGVIEQHGLDLKIVYRPHPHRRPRKTPDFVDESRFRHVVLDPQIRDTYLESFEEYGPKAKRKKPLFPALDYYPALFEHTEFVICPLSTMMIEAAAFERRVLVVAYDDGIHPNAPNVVRRYDHFEGIEQLDGFSVAETLDGLGEGVQRLAAGEGMPARPLRDQIQWYLHHDERTYGERLAALLERLYGKPRAERREEAHGLAR
jgi:hypothetical protein